MRYQGLNWEGRRWTCPPSIRALGGQVTAVAGRPTNHDGTVASKTHDQVNPKSDHRPTPYTGPGIVRAMDVTVTVDQGNVWTDSIRLSKDPRVKYVIYAGRKFASSSGAHPAWTWYEYLGPNPHTNHFHMSTLESADNNGSSWDLNGGSMDGPNGEPQWDKVSSWAKNSWTKAWTAGLLNNEADDSRDSDPQDVITKEVLMVHLDRAGVI